jgi:hypothetical protein
MNNLLSAAACISFLTFTTLACNSDLLKTESNSLAANSSATDSNVKEDDFFHRYANRPCAIKQKNAASYELAQKIGISVQSVEVISLKGGGWTEAFGPNSGFDFVVVSGKNGTTGQVTTLRYQVDAKELDVEMMNAQDCKVLKVIEQ